MMVSTKGRYALRVMLDLAMQKQEEYVSLNDIAQRQKISCMDGEGCGPECELLANCLTRPMWNRLDEIIDEYLSSVSIQDLLDGRC